jgi:hypothetical protein
MAIIGSNSIVSQIYNAVQGNSNKSAGAARDVVTSPVSAVSEFRLPSNATPRGDWVLSDNASPQNFESGSPRGTYLNVVV